MERTLAILKPEAVQRGLIGKIVSMIEQGSFKIRAAKLVRVGKQQAMNHYRVHESKPFYPDLVEYITSGPIFVMVLEGEDAVGRLRELMGATDPTRAAEGTIRRLYGESIERNIIHGSDSPWTAETEIKLFFTEEELESL